MSIKYSEILTASEVLSAGDDDIIVLAIVDGGAPTGYTTKAIKKSNLITGSAQNLQQVLDTGSTATGITTGMTVLTEDTSITFESSDVTGGNSVSTLDLYAQNTGAVYASLRIEDDGANVTELNFTSPSDGVGTFTFSDGITSKGLVYAADYSANFTNESLVTKRYVDASAGVKTIYSDDDNLASDRIVGMAAFDLRFTGTGEYSIGGTEAGSTFTVDGQLTTGSIYTFKRDFDAAVGQKGFKNTINNRGSEVRRVRTNGTAFSIWNEWTIGDNRKSVDFIVSPNNNYLSLYDAGTGLIEQARIGDEISWWNADNKAYGFGFGHNAPPARTIHSKNMDWKIEGTTDANLLVTDESTNQLSIGSTPYANVKASITNAEGVATTFVVLNQATNKNFQVMETGVVSTNGQVSIGYGTAPTATASLLVAGGIEIFSATYIYYGDALTDGSYRQGNDGLGNYIVQERIAGVWTTIQTL